MLVISLGLTNEFMAQTMPDKIIVIPTTESVIIIFRISDFGFDLKRVFLWASRQLLLSHHSSTLAQT
jgi:hypothetical protein